jgi:hypothetical protein
MTVDAPSLAPPDVPEASCPVAFEGDIDGWRFHGLPRVQA